MEKVIFAEQKEKVTKRKMNKKRKGKGMIRRFFDGCREYSSQADQRLAKSIEMNKLKIEKQKQENELEKLKSQKPKREYYMEPLFK